ncbi:hypothetical protein QBC41DRAFT_20592 [Cercophora samala]|uniref:Uncharacterized protein n=1 Tax=Cercophora samala TaxID=330535 RepID=A0AA39Z5D4_9PEZI|nr:hypothetical protein QBC41DRAFT_20592 [Cercophora samala]
MSARIRRKADRRHDRGLHTGFRERKCGWQPAASNGLLLLLLHCQEKGTRREVVDLNAQGGHTIAHQKGPSAEKPWWLVVAPTAQLARCGWRDSTITQFNQPPPTGDCGSISSRTRFPTILPCGGGQRFSVSVCGQDFPRRYRGIDRQLAPLGYDVKSAPLLIRSPTPRDMDIRAWLAEWATAYRPHRGRQLVLYAAGCG